MAIVTNQVASEAPTMQQMRVLSRREIEGMISEGQHIIIVSQYVLKVDSWLSYHPGGEKTIMHMVGRDATNEVTVLHGSDALKHMMRYRIGKIENRWENFSPPIQGGHFRPLTAEEDQSSDQLYDNLTPKTNSALSEASTREASPVFDLDYTSESLRHRCGPSSSSISTNSAREESYDATTPNGFLDAQTKAEIRLDLDKYPSVDCQTQDEIVQKYMLLEANLESEGLFQCNYTAYAVETCRYVLLFLGMLFFLNKEWYFVSAACLGILWQQLVFAAHDAAHMGITHNFHIDSCIAIFIGDFMGGLSVGWWKRNHNIHHVVTNHPEHDPDIEHMPFLAVSHRLLGNLFSSYYERLMAYDRVAKAFLRVQSYTYYLLMLFGRFNLYFLSWDHMIARRGPKRGPAAYQYYLEVAGQVFFWAWFGYGILYKSIPTGWNRFVFILTSHMLQSPLHVQFTLSHFAMSTADLGPEESFPQKMLRTTMDIDCPPWLDFLHGGLQFQAIHHLFPRMPRHNLRRAQRLVQEFCIDVGIPYALYGFVDSNKEVVGRLAEVSRQAVIFAECQKVASKQ